MIHPEQSFLKWDFVAVRLQKAGASKITQRIRPIFLGVDFGASAQEIQTPVQRRPREGAIRHRDRFVETSRAIIDCRFVTQIVGA